MFRVILSASVVIVLLFTACEAETTVEAPAESAVVEASEPAWFKFGTPHQYQWKDLQGAERERVKALATRHLRDAAIAFEGVRGILRSADVAPGAKLAAIQQITEQHDGAEYEYMLDQMIAREVLSPMVQDDAKSLSSAEREIVGIAARLLVENNNPNADYIYEGLVHQKGEWDGGEIRRLAQRAIPAAERWLMAECDGCKNAMQQRPEAEKAYGRRVVSVQQAVQALQSL
jgi:hypothetical protein